MRSKYSLQIKLSLPLSVVSLLLLLPLVSAAQETITFSSGRDGDLEIFSMRPDGSLPTQLTSNTNFDWQPSASSDGSRIVFTSNRDFDDEIYIMNADGSGQTNLTNSAAAEFEPAISPDGTLVAFVFQFGQIYLMGADGSNRTFLTNGIQPSFSPDGTRIVFTGNDGDYEIYTINIDGTNRTQITQNAANDLYPKFSRDGNRIAFVSDRDGDTAVYIMNADSTGQTRLAETLTNIIFDPNQLSFSPDGTRIAFMYKLGGNYEIYTIGTDGSDLVRLTENGAFDGQPSWSGFPLVAPVLNAPSDLHADNVQANLINLQWTDNSGHETGFIIEQCRNRNCTNAVQIGHVGANTTTFLHTPLLPNTQYTYRVAAITDTDRSPFSNTIMVKTLRK